MKTFWFRMLTWFSVTLVIVTLGFAAVFWKVRPQEIGGLLIPGVIYMGGVIAVFALTTWAVARKTFTPIISLNDQLDAIEPQNLRRAVRLETGDPELRELQEHINNLLARISLSVIQLQNYSAQVAHELRAPLTIIRLKIEQAADKIEPALAEEVQSELLRLTLHVEQSLLIARAEQGHLPLNRTRFDLAELLEDVAQDFRLLAREQNREVRVDVVPAAVSADYKYTRQILYSLLTNSIRHGRGDISVHLEKGRDQVTLAISNELKLEESDEHSDLGVGRRIVAALVAVQQNMKLETNRSTDRYEVRLIVLDPKNGTGMPTPEIRSVSEN